MKKFICSSSLLLLLASCGNPHIEGKKGLESFTPTQDADDTLPTGGTPFGESRLYVGSASDSHRGNVVTGFAQDTRKKPSLRIDFNQVRPGRYSLLGSEEERYRFTLKQELIQPSGVRRTITDFFGHPNLSFLVESPVSQDRAVGEDTGVVTQGATNQNEKVAGLWRFKQPITHFGATLVDVESTSYIQAKFRLFDCQNKLVQEIPYVYPNNEDGNSEIHFVGFTTALQNVCSVSLTVGDYPAGVRDDGHNNGSERGIALDDFVYGVISE